MNAPSAKKSQPLWVTRFAPSPTGWLHLGHLVNALYVWGVARAMDGEVILRIEDHDRGRCRPEYEAGILEDLEWLNLRPDRGTIAGFRQGRSPLRQSDNTAVYAEKLNDLAKRGLLYTCTCSRKSLLARTGPQLGELCYDGHCRERGYRPGEAGAVRVRFDVETIEAVDVRLGRLQQNPVEQCGDLLIRDALGNWAYQFAVAVDDWQQDVNLIVRGEDLLASTGRQVQLARLLGRKDTPLFLHHPLIANPEGKKLSKRDFAKGLRDYRAEGWSAARALGDAAWRVGLITENSPQSFEEILGQLERSLTIDGLRERAMRAMHNL